MRTYVCTYVRMYVCHAIHVMPCFSETAKDISMKLGIWVEGKICQAGFLNFFYNLKVKVTAAIFVAKL